jgi:NAD+ dependent glucose-6-phosphate dehydrogenase
MKTRVLVTGMSGLIGGAVQRRLAGRYELTALNRRTVPDVRSVQADISDLDAIRPAFDGQDVVVHLSAVLGDSTGWEPLRRVNIDGTYNVLEAARQAGVQRVIFASSGSVIAGWEQENPYTALASGDYAQVEAPWPLLTHETAPRPRGLYGASKAAGEALARHFADATPLSVICLRIGRVTKEDRPMTPRDYSIWCSQADIAQMVECCILAPPSVQFDIFYAVSENRWGYRDISHAQQVVGYRPEGQAETYRPAASI